MAYSISVSNLDNNLTWNKTFTKDEYTALVDSYENVDRECIGVLPATLYPVRTNTLQNFVDDFFLPTFVNHALKVQDTVGSVFAILGSLILDILTFPVRLVTVIPRAIFNANQSEHPLLTYLKKENVDPKLYESDHVGVTQNWLTRKWSGSSKYADGTVENRYSDVNYYRSGNINFIETPMYPGHSQHYYGENGRAPEPEFDRGCTVS